MAISAATRRQISSTLRPVVMGITVFGRFEHPVQGLGVVCRHALAGQVHQPQIELSPGIAGPGRHCVPFLGGGKIRRSGQAL